MTTLTPSPSARRLAAFLHQEDCVFMASPSVALLSALLAGTGRPQRLLVDEGAPDFIANVGRIAGAVSVRVAPGQVNPALRRLIESDGVDASLIWAVATHRDGHLAPDAWLAACRPYGVPTIDFCLGSLFALARRPGPAATVTIVSLDAEAALSGANLTALLTRDLSVAGRVRQLCLPGPTDTDYVLDASPRGLGHDEAGLLGLVEDAIARAEAEEDRRPPGTSAAGGGGVGFRPLLEAAISDRRARGPGSGRGGGDRPCFRGSQSVARPPGRGRGAPPGGEARRGRERGEDAGTPRRAAVRP